MKKATTLMLIFLLAVCSGLLFSCEKSEPLPGDPVIIELTLKQAAVVESANQFAFDIFKPIIEQSDCGENIMISPFSVSSALSMTMNGAEGQTLGDMKSALCYGNHTLDEINDAYLKLMTDMISVDPRVIMEIANSVWVEQDFSVKGGFINTLETWYKAETGSFDVTDPGAPDMVNAWIEEKTHDKIQKMLDSFDPNLKMLLVNAIYFNGKWRNRFDVSDTQDKEFYITPDSPVIVPIMNQEENLGVKKTGNATLVELPYGQGNYSMVVMLPDEGVSVAEAVDAITPEYWDEWMSSLQNSVVEVNLSLPRFKYEYKRTLNDDLCDLGMGIAFDSDLADFSNISDQQLYISFVLHQTFIETNEEGTEAAAATVVGMVTSSIPQVVTVNVNRPFVYFIRETTTGTIVFMGQVVDPSL